MAELLKCNILDNSYFKEWCKEFWIKGFRHTINYDNLLGKLNVVNWSSDIFHKYEMLLNTCVMFL